MNVGFRSSKYQLVNPVTWQCSPYGHYTMFPGTRSSIYLMKSPYIITRCGGNEDYEFGSFDGLPQIRVRYQNIITFGSVSISDIKQLQSIDSGPVVLK